MSNFFDVTTDYILKGIEPIVDEPMPQNVKPNASIFSIIGTAFNFVGIVVSAMIWYEEQVATATAVGTIFLIIGCMIYGIGMAVANKNTTNKAKRVFWAINVWTVTFIPLSMGYNILSGAKGTAPYPILVGSHINYILFWIIYIAIGIICNIIIHQKSKNNHI